MVENGICRDCGKVVAPGAEGLHPRYCTSDRAAQRSLEQAHEARSGCVSPSWAQEGYRCPGCRLEVAVGARSLHPRYCARTYGEPDRVPGWVSDPRQGPFPEGYNRPKGKATLAFQIFAVLCALALFVKVGPIALVFVVPVVLIVLVAEFYERVEDRSVAKKVYVATVIGDIALGMLNAHQRRNRDTRTDVPFDARDDLYPYSDGYVDRRGGYGEAPSQRNPLDYGG